MTFTENYSLKELNTFGIDVIADKFIQIDTYEEVADKNLINELKKAKIYILGGGSNILFSENVKGVVLKNNIQGIKELYSNDKSITLEVGGGVVWDELVEYAVENELYGIENLSLIPGTVGAAPIQNIGAYGVEFESVFVKLNGIDLINGEEKSFNKEQCKFGYRDSIFKRKYKNQFLITSVTIKLNRLKNFNTSYRAIQDYISENKINTKNLSLKELRNIIIDIRQSKLPDPQKLGNAGSFFKNPIVKKDVIDTIKKKHKDIVFFKVNDELYKIAAGWLIEKIGYKGKTKGNVGVHKNQALVLVNYGGASGKELVGFSEEIKEKIFDKFNINLETEVNII